MEAEPVGEGVIVRFAELKNLLVSRRDHVVCKVLELLKSSSDRQRDPSSRWAPLFMTTMSPKQWTASIDCCKRNGLRRCELTPTVELSNDAAQVFLAFQIHEGDRANLPYQRSR